MVIHAYSDDYLISAQRILGNMLDFAVNTYDMDIDKFFEMFLVSNVSRQFETGNPTYVAGKTGCELVKEVIRDSGLRMEECPDELWNQHYLETNLKRIRNLAGLSQRELADLSGVSVRQIQLFEQRQRDINQTRAIDVLRLSRVLGCRNEDLLEI